VTTSALSWHWQRFSELRLEQLHAILAARQEVFIVGQGLNYVDADSFDHEAFHLSAWDLRGPLPELAAYLRLIPLAAAAKKYLSPSDIDSGRPVYKIGRVLTRHNHRGVGIGIELMRELLSVLGKTHVPCRLTMSAQSYLEAFYNKFGFSSEGEIYLEEGLEHIRMSLDLGT
jgi:ElaA protein